MHGLAMLFRGPLRRVTTVAIFISVCNLVPYYAFQSWVPTYLLHQGISLRNSLGLSVFMQLGAIPGAIIGGLLGDYLGRKWTNVGLFVALGVIGLVYANSDSSAELMVTGFLWVMVANIAIALQIASYIPELFPTSVRMQGSALANAFGRLGTIFAPYLVSATVSSLGVSAVFVGSCAVFVLGALAVAVLGPETKGRSLEDIASGYRG
jgi:MFS transporter, putative metabolite:H+ symporter